MVDKDNNIDFSAFVYEFINKYSALENNTDNLKQYFKSIYSKEKQRTSLKMKFLGLT